MSIPTASKPTPSLSPDRRHCLELLRDARALVLRDAESFHEAASVLEHVGQILCGEVRNGLGYYARPIVDLAVHTDRHPADEVMRLFNVVRSSRNDAAHDGAWARHLNTRLVDLLLILEEAIMADAKLVEDIMVRSPVAAETWQTVNQARRTMLANSFSCLPIFVANEWHLLRDSAIVQYLSTDPENRKDLLAKRIEDALASRLTKAKTCTPNDPVAKAVELLEESLPVLVVEEIGGIPRLQGIVTAFDLL